MFYINDTFVRFENDLKNSSTYANQDRVDDALREIKNIKSSLYESFKSLAYLRNFDNEKLAYYQMLQQAQLFETTRWTIMVVAVVINMLLILLLITGLIKDSKGSLCL
jgi:hypothetical protein